MYAAIEQLQHIVIRRVLRFFDRNTNIRLKECECRQNSWPPSSEDRDMLRRNTGIVIGIVVVGNCRPELDLAGRFWILQIGGIEIDPGW
jgi:hypothetical protein